ALGTISRRVVAGIERGEDDDRLLFPGCPLDLVAAFRSLESQFEISRVRTPREEECQSGDRNEQRTLHRFFLRLWINPNVFVLCFRKGTFTNPKTRTRRESSLMRNSLPHPQVLLRLSTVDRRLKVTRSGPRSPEREVSSFPSRGSSVAAGNLGYGQNGVLQLSVLTPATVAQAGNGALT